MPTPLSPLKLGANANFVVPIEYLLNASKGVTTCLMQLSYATAISIGYHPLSDVDNQFSVGHGAQDRRFAASVLTTVLVEYS